MIPVYFKYFLVRTPGVTEKKNEACGFPSFLTETSSEKSLLHIR